MMFTQKGPRPTGWSKSKGRSQYSAVADSEGEVAWCNKKFHSSQFTTTWSSSVQELRDVPSLMHSQPFQGRNLSELAWWNAHHCLNQTGSSESFYNLGGVIALKRLGIESCLEGIDAIPVKGYCVVEGGKSAHIPYPGMYEGRIFTMEGLSWSYGRLRHEPRVLKW